MDVVVGLDSGTTATKAVTAIAALARDSGDRVVGIALSAAMHGLVPMDGDGAPLGPVVTWADARAAEWAQALVADGRAPALHARTGTPEGTGLGACLLGLHALGALPDLDAATALVTVHDPVVPDPADAAVYRELRPLVERSTDALTDVLTALDALDDTPSDPV